MADLVLTLVDLLPSVRVAEGPSDDLVLTFASILKGDQGIQGPPGRDSDPADVVALLAASHSIQFVGLDGQPIVTVFGNPA